jgi:50S ribosomal protein L16 3-hydroxylase
MTAMMMVAIFAASSLFALSHGFVVSPQTARGGRVKLCTSASSQETGVDVTEGIFSASLLADHWGRKPLLMRKAFASSEENSAQPSWPSWELMMNEIACEEDSETRIIRHTPGDLSSYSLDVGPFDDLDFLVEEDDKWTLVVNDVDRFHPPLSDWVDHHFNFIPRWRRDDAQISLAPLGGGIGPHVDNYDVFLIQTSGRREWQVGLDLVSAKDELDSSVPGINVRILENWEERRESSVIVTLVLEEGDALYLPPRIPHCGTAVTDQCMTLSVGCRAPSATELVARLAEGLSESLSDGAVQRYQDADMLQLQQQQQQSVEQSLKNLADAELTGAIKDKMKQMVLDAVQEVLDDDAQWDALVGRITTEPTRPREDYPISLEETDPEWREELGIWGHPEKAIKAVLNGDGALFRAEGVSATFSIITGEPYRIFMNGVMFEVGVPEEEKEELRILLTALVDAPALTKETLTKLSHQGPVMELLENLVQRGLLYGSSNEDDEYNIYAKSTFSF